MEQVICGIGHLPPYPFEEELKRLFGESRKTVTLTSRPLYLDLAEAIISQAASWIDEHGVVIDPVEGHDDCWKGGTAARFACPAAILVRERNRTDLIAPATRALSQLAGGILQCAARGSGFYPGALDLMMEDIVIAWDILRQYVEPATAESWRAAITAVPGDSVYKARQLVAEGRSINNYGPAAAVGEWLRCRHGLGGVRDWVERYLEFSLPWFTEWGLFRDPGDPILYDFKVRHSLAQLLHYGYDGAFRAQMDELLRRGGLTMLLTLSPCGWTPFGGRSNLLLHNEAMAVFLYEYEASRWMERGRPEIASAFKEAAVRAARATEPFVRRVPLRYIKNNFAPSLRHGKDAAYGEYAGYALLAASLFARAALAVNDGIPAVAVPAASRGCVISLWPAFHKVFATCGDTHVELDTRAEPGHDATGLGRFHRAGAPPELALAATIPAHPHFVVHEAATERSAAIGPCWLDGGGKWRALAELAGEIEGVSFSRLAVSPESVAWALAWSFASESRISLSSVIQRFVLSEGHLHIEATAYGLFTRFGFEIPCLVNDGETAARIEVADTTVKVEHGGWVYMAHAPKSRRVTLEETIRANRNAKYRLARFEVDAQYLTINLSLEKVGRKCMVALPAKDD